MDQTVNTAQSAAQLPRYLSSKGWTHIFVTPIEVTTRWIYDRETGGIAYAEVRWGFGWQPLDKSDRADLLESLQHNEIERDWEQFEIEASDELPDWAAGCALEGQEPERGRGATQRCG